MVALGSFADNDSICTKENFENSQSSVQPSLIATHQHQGGIIILARVSPSTETDFAQILLPLALSYETFVCKLCVALGVQRTDVRKIKKLPDILIRTTEDVIRLEEFDKLELRLKRQNFIHSTAQKIRNFGGKLANFAFYAILVACACFILRTEFQNQEMIQEFATQIGNLATGIKLIRSEIDKLSEEQNQTPEKPDLNALFSRHWEALEDSLRNTDQIVQKKVEKLEKGVGMLAQRIKETKLLFASGLKEFLEDFRGYNCKDKDRF